jgi:hypothetical protein
MENVHHFPPGKCHSMTFGEQKHPIFVSQTYLFSYLVTKTPLFCFPNDFLIIQGDVTPSKMKNIFGACEASDKPSGGIRNACLSSERRQAWRMCILFPPSGEMSRSDNRGYLRSLRSKRQAIRRHPECVSFVRKTASMEDVHPFPPIGGNVAKRQ